MVEPFEVLLDCESDIRLRSSYPEREHNIEFLTTTVGVL